jgi:hypothetical protein
MSVFFNAITVDPSSLDAELEDAGTVGPELAFIAREQRLLARAFCWRDASSDWPLLVVQIPGTEALWMLQHPVFTPIIRRWGMALRAALEFRAKRWPSIFEPCLMTKHWLDCENHFMRIPRKPQSI